MNYSCAHSYWKLVYKVMSMTHNRDSTSAHYSVWECCGCGITEVRW